jgi:hypothetical protein
MVYFSNVLCSLLVYEVQNISRSKIGIADAALSSYP